MAPIQSASFPKISIREVTSQTVRMICNLIADPPGFVAPNAVSIAQAYFHPEAWFRAIYADDAPVGFVMLEDSALLPTPPPQHSVFLWRFMIHAPEKGKGYGKAALILVIDDLRKRYPQLDVFRTSSVPGANSPRPFYEALGFAFNGEIEDGEEVLVLDLKSWRASH